MLQNISKTAASYAPIASVGCFALAGYAGRKFVLAGGCKVLSAAAGAIGQENAALKLEMASQDYWTLAKKTAVRDLTAVGGLVALGVASAYAGKTFEKDAPKIEKKEGPELIKEPQPEPGPFEYYGTPVLKFYDRVAITLWDYKKTTFAALYSAEVAMIAAVYKYRRPLSELGIAGIQKMDQFHESLQGPQQRRQVQAVSQLLIDGLSAFGNFNINKMF